MRAPAASVQLPVEFNSNWLVQLTTVTDTLQPIPIIQLIIRASSQKELCRTFRVPLVAARRPRQLRRQRRPQIAQRPRNDHIIINPDQERYNKHSVSESCEMNKGKIVKKKKSKLVRVAADRWRILKERADLPFYHLLLFISIIYFIYYYLLSLLVII